MMSDASQRTSSRITPSMKSSGRRGSTGRGTSGSAAPIAHPGEHAVVVDVEGLPRAVALLAELEPVPRADEVSRAHARRRQRRAHVGAGVRRHEHLVTHAPRHDVQAGHAELARLRGQAARGIDDVPVAVRARESARSSDFEISRGFACFQSGRERALGQLDGRQRGAELPDVAHRIRLASVSARRRPRSPRRGIERMVSGRTPWGARS